MRLISKYLVVKWFVLNICCRTVISNDDVAEKGHAVQVLSFQDQSIHLHMNELNSILLRNDLEDHKLVVISIAGPFRQGKSFLTNFFIKFLNSRYKRHNASDWLEDGGKLEGFKWRSGQKRETTGIWIWSDIFTHEYSNGEKYAIILMDTQGVFDHQSSLKDNTLIFALSMMMSSVQCYNLMHNIKEDDLQNLRLFSEYGRLVLNQTSDKPFQKLLFIVRDWPFASETGYGWSGRQIIRNILGNTDDQTEENILLRKRIKSSFQEIDAFLLPSPGRIVEEGRNFTGSINQIGSEFKTYVKSFTEELFRPDKLIVKQINGQQLSAHDWLLYLQNYLKLFSQSQIPEPKHIFEATMEANNMKIYYDALTLYDKGMSKSLAEAEHYLNENILLFRHRNFSNKSMEMFQKSMKLGDEKSIAKLRRNIEESIERKFIYYQRENDLKRTNFNKNADAYNDILINQIEYELRERFEKELRTSPNFDSDDFLNRFDAAKMSALNKFDDKCMGELKNSLKYRDRLESNLNSLENTLRFMINSQQSVTIQHATQTPAKSHSDEQKISTLMSLVTKVITILACSTIGLIGMSICEPGSAIA